MRSILKRALVFVATLSLGGAAIVHSGEQDALAKGGQDKQEQTQIQKTQQQQAQQQKLSVKQQTEYVQSWADSEEPVPADQYSSNGLKLVHGTLQGLAEQLEQQPVGGGPAEEEMTQQEREQMQQQRQQLQQALQQIQTQHQQLGQVADQIDDGQNLMQRPQQFQQGAMSVVSILDSLQQAKFNQFSNQIEKVRQSAESIEIDKPLSAQQKDVQAFFVRTSDVLNKMAEQLEEEQAAVGGGPADSEQDKQKQKDNKQQNKQQNQQQ